MNEIFRARIFNQAIINASAEEVWSVLIDWGGIEKLERKDIDPGVFKLDRVELIGDPKRTPRTRVIHFASSMAPIREILLNQDDRLMHLSYCMDGEGPMGMHNYLATTDVDRISPELSQVTVTARFDIPSSKDVVGAKAVIDGAHIGAVISNIEHYLVKKRGA